MSAQGPENPGAVTRSASRQNKRLSVSPRPATREPLGNISNQQSEEREAPGSRKKARKNTSQASSNSQWNGNNGHRNNQHNQHNQHGQHGQQGNNNRPSEQQQTTRGQHGQQQHGQHGNNRRNNRHNSGHNNRSSENHESSNGQSNGHARGLNTRSANRRPRSSKSSNSTSQKRSEKHVDKGQAGTAQENLTKDVVQPADTTSSLPWTSTASTASTTSTASTSTTSTASITFTNSSNSSNRSNRSNRSNSSSSNSNSNTSTTSVFSAPVSIAGGGGGRGRGVAGLLRGRQEEQARRAASSSEAVELINAVHMEDEVEEEATVCSAANTRSFFDYGETDQNKIRDFICQAACAYKDNKVLLARDLTAKFPQLVQTNERALHIISQALDGNGGGRRIQPNSQEFPKKISVFDLAVGAAAGPRAEPVFQALWSEESAVCFQYADDIHAVLKENEMRHRPLRDYVTSVQNDINYQMRGVLVDWLVEVAQEYRLSTQTLFLTINYIDRLLSARLVDRNRLQLVGITAMLIGSKYEEIYPPSIDDFVYISDNTYSRVEVLAMETVLLNTLNFSLSAATPWDFCTRLFRAAKLDEQTTHLTHYLLELFVLDRNYLGFYPSVIASSCVFLALWTLHQPPWTNLLTRASEHTAQQLVVCVTHIDQAFRQTSPKLRAVREKFRDITVGPRSHLPADLFGATHRAADGN